MNLKPFTLNVHPAKALSCHVVEFLAGLQELAEDCFGLFSEVGRLKEQHLLENIEKQTARLLDAVIRDGQLLAKEQVKRRIRQHGLSRPASGSSA